MNTILKLQVFSLLMCSSMAGFSVAKNPNTSSNHPAVNQAAKPNDGILTKNVNSALAGEYNKIKVTIKEGIVYLKGELPSDMDYEKMITRSESVKGVKDVNVDDLTVKESASPLFDTYMTGKIKGSLIQYDILQKDIPSWSIRVETKAGQIYLSGKVANEEERQNIVKVVKSVKGVNQVHDQIEIKSEPKNVE